MKNLCYLLLLVAIHFNCKQELEIINGHSHNDYECERPLFNALQYGFISVEIDVHLMEGNLYVSHDLPEVLNPDFTIEKLYLEPLRNHIQKNNGFVYPLYSESFLLMIDFKSQAGPTYEKLKEILLNYRSILSTVSEKGEEKGPVKIFISGERPFAEVLNEKTKLVGLDGRPDDLSKNIASAIMPVVSDNYSNILTWDGYGQIPQSDKSKLDQLVKETHLQNKKLRLWAAPDHPDVWGFLLDHKVDLINTDRLEEFRKFALKYKSMN